LAPGHVRYVQFEFQSDFLPASCALRTRPAGLISLCFPYLYIYLCVDTYHVHNNYITSSHTLCHATLSI